MKIILLSSIFLLSIICKGQTKLTYGQVFNFEIGDVIQGIHRSYDNLHYYPPMYETNTILSKKLTTNNDSIIYTVQIDTYIPPTCPTCTATSGTGTVTQVVTNLNSNIPNANHTTCFPTHDSLYYNSCNNRVYQVHPAFITGCFEATTETSQYIEGVGGPFFNRYIGNSPDRTTEEFIFNYYIKKSGNCPIGLFINEKKNNLNISNIYPNPSKDIIHFISDTELCRFDIFDLTGKMCLDGYTTNNQINIGVLNSGTYIVNVYSLDLRVNTAKITKD